MTKNRLHNLMIIESMFVASIVMLVGITKSYWALVLLGIAWQAFVFLENAKPGKEENDGSDN